MSDGALKGLAGVVDALLDAGAAVAGDVTIGVADVDLAVVNLRALVTGVQAHIDRGNLAPASRPPARPDRRPPVRIPARIDVDRDRRDAGLGRLVVAVAEILHQVVEGQALARLDGGSLTPDQEERLGQALMAMRDQLAQLRKLFAHDRRRFEEMTCRP
jgi:hypothetical protein